MFLPNSISPRLSHRFMVSLEDIESHWITSAEFPKNLMPYHEGISGGSVIVGIVCVDGERSSESRIVELCKKKNIEDVKILMLDSVGDVSCTYTLNQCSISEIKLPILTYESSNPLEWFITIAFKRLFVS